MPRGIIQYEVREGASTRHTGTSKREAERAFTMWCRYARNREGTPQPTTITLTADNQPIKTETIRP